MGVRRTAGIGICGATNGTESDCILYAKGGRTSRCQGMLGGAPFPNTAVLRSAGTEFAVCTSRPYAYGRVYSLMRPVRSGTCLPPPQIVETLGDEHRRVRKLTPTSLFSPRSLVEAWYRASKGWRTRGYACVIMISRSGAPSWGARLRCSVSDNANLATVTE